MQMRRVAMAAAVGVAVALSACGNGPPSTGGGGGGGGGAGIGKAAASGLGTPASKVAATANLAFSPTTTTVKTGGVVEWSNTGGVPHNVTFDSYQAITSTTLQQGDTWEIQFTVAGTYSYHCTFHPGMDGTITVGG